MNKEKLMKLFVIACSQANLFQMRNSSSDSYFEVTFIRADAPNFDLGICKGDKASYHLYMKYISYNSWDEKQQVEYNVLIDKEDFQNLKNHYKSVYEEKINKFIPELA